MPTTDTETKIELASEKNRTWVLVSAVTVLVLIVQGFYTSSITTASGEIKSAREQITKLVTTVEVQQVRQEALADRTKHLETENAESKKECQQLTLRVNSLEQRAALFDQHMQAHK